ncbi:MAG: DUF6482 family protein [Halioglobus sp.]
MKISIRELKSQRCVERVIIQSVDLSLYIAFAVSGDTELLITDSDGSSLKTRNLLKMRELLSPLNIESLVLRQESPYDEMVGQSADKIDNSLEVSLSTELYPAPARTLH